MLNNRICVYIINALENGGAERVVINECNKLVEKGHNVIIITLRNYNAYNFDKKIKIINITKKKSFNKIEKILLIPLLVSKINKILHKIESEYEIELLTSHLPYTHIITRLTKYTNKILYVIHNPHFQFKNSSKWWFKKVLNTVYDNQKIIAVSNGVENEMKNDYKIKTNTIKTIYNPLNMIEINEKLNKPNVVDVKEKYLLICGRLEEQKNIERMINVFIHGDFYKNYKLVIIGVGSLKEYLLNKIKMENMEDKIILKGWQENVYQWMKKSELLVCTSDYESFGMVLAEALACDTKVVSVDCKYGPNEILIDELSKYLCSFNEKDIIDKINYALNNYPNKLSGFVSKFDVNLINKQYLATYEMWR